MAAAVQVSTRGEVENVAIIAASSAIRLEMIGNFSMARRVHAAPGETFAVLVSGNDVTVDDLVMSGGGGTGDAALEVTGLRAHLFNIQSANAATASAVRFNGAADCILDGLTSNSDDTGLELASSTRIQVRNVHITASDNEGVLVTSSTRCVFEGIVYNSGRHGISITDSSYNRFSGQIIDAGKDTNNTYDGCIIAGNSDHNRTEFTVTYLGAGNQARYGLNISASTVDGHIEASYLEAGATADFNDAGTGTVLTDDHIT